jgi:hypothetical protein
MIIDVVLVLRFVSNARAKTLLRTIVCCTINSLLQSPNVFSLQQIFTRLLRINYSHNKFYL